MQIVIVITCLFHSTGSRTQETCHFLNCLYVVYFEITFLDVELMRGWNNHTQEY